MKRLLFVSCILLLITCTINTQDTTNTPNEIIDCGKTTNSVAKDGGYWTIQEGMEELIQDDVLKCFGNNLISNECIDSTVQTDVYSFGGDSSTYRFTIFSKNNVCYINVESKDSGMACPKDISKGLKDYEKYNVDVKKVVMTFTDAFLSDLTVKHKGIKSGFVSDKDCFVVN